jgi:hypothetical protein
VSVVIHAVARQLVLFYALTRLASILLTVGINAAGIRKVIKASSRYAIPLIVSTGRPYRPSNETQNRRAFLDRYPLADVMYSDEIGTPLFSNHTLPLR